MEIPHPNATLSPDKPRNASDWQFQRQLELQLNELKADMVERPFLYSGIAFVAGFVANTFPARILFHVLASLVSWLLGPAILLLGVLKIGDAFSSGRRIEPTVLQRP